MKATPEQAAWTQGYDAALALVERRAARWRERAESAVQHAALTDNTAIANARLARAEQLHACAREILEDVGR